MQDGTGDYDLRFGQAFYNFSFFDVISQESILKKINLPTLIMHVEAPKETKPSYYNSEGILLSSMDEKDAKRVNELIKGSKLIEGYDSMHDIHDDLPNKYIDDILEFKKSLENN